MSNISYDFSGKVVLITGSSSGIGAETAVLFAKSGADVIITSNVADELDHVADRCRKISPNNSKTLQVLADFTKEEDIKRLVETTIKEFGKLDVLINNVGVLLVKPITDPDYMNAFKSVMQINLYSSVYLTHLCVEYLSKTNGNIINTSSVAALQSNGQTSMYSTSKCTLVMFTKCMAAELGPKGIRVNCILPGGIRTKIFERLGMPKEMEDRLLKVSVESQYPVGRVGHPIEVASAMLFLAADESSFITGAVLGVDGGHLAANVSFKF